MNDRTDPSPTGPSSELLEKLLESHRELLAFVEKRVRNRALAEDILQDAFVRRAEKEAAPRDEEAALPWFRRVLRNAVIDHHRRGGAANRALEAFAAELATQADDDVETTACRCVTALATTLKPEYAAILQRVDVDGIPVKQFAEEAGITANNAAVRVFRAREALRTQVASSCGTCATHGCFDCTCEPATEAARER